MKSFVQCCGGMTGNAVPGDRIYVDRGRENSGISGAFSDPRVCLVTPFDVRVAVLPQIDSTHCQVQQGQASPTYLVIGPNVTDESLCRASERFGIPMADLLEFRAANQDAELLPIWSPVLEISTSDESSKFEVVGDPMPKKLAWKVAESAAEKRGGVVSVIVRMARRRDHRSQ